MRELKYHLFLTDEEYSLIIHSLIDLKNKMMEQGHYTDLIDDLLLKFSKSKKKKIKLNK